MNTKGSISATMTAVAFVGLGLLTACEQSVTAAIVGLSDQGGSRPPEPLPAGYEVRVTPVNGRTVECQLVRGVDDPSTPLVGVTFEVVFPASVGAISVSSKTVGSVVSGGEVGVGVDQDDSRRVTVAAAKPWDDPIRGTGELLRFQVVSSSDIPRGVLPAIENKVLFRMSSTGAFAEVAPDNSPWTVK